MIKLGFLARELVGILTSVGLVLGVAAITLWVLNGVPTQIQGTNKVLEFKDTRDAQLALGIKISRPAYFPDYLAWPPALIQAQKRPAIAVLMTFTSREQDREVLWIHEVIGQVDKVFVTQLPEPKKALQRSKIDLNGDEAELVLGQGLDGEAYNCIRWKHSNRYIAMATVYSQEELLKMARSMTY